MIDYESRIPSHIREIKPSGIRKFFDLVSGKPDVISLTIGEPDFVTPWHIREAGIESLEKGKTYYSANAGLAELRTEISRYLSRRFDGDATKIVCAYHAGQGNVDAWLKNPAYSKDGVTLDVIPTQDTAAYASRVLRARDVYRKYYFPLPTPVPADI